MKKVFLAGALGFILGIGVCTAAADCVPGIPEGPVMSDDPLAGLPPSIHQAAFEIGAEQMQVEYWKETDDVWSLSFRGGLPDDFIAEWAGDGDTNWYARSATGPGGFRVFSTGTYRVQWRGHNSCGFGPWATSMPFQVNSTTLTTRITEGQRRVRAADDLAFTWENNFAASAHRVQIRRNGRLLRSKNLPGMYQDGWLSYQPRSYQDRPATPRQELRNGTGYVFRVSSWSPAQAAWSPWTTWPFHILRGRSPVPSLSISQQDFNGAFRKSPRPFFNAEYGNGNTPALWTCFDIRRPAGDRLQVVRRKWASRYQESFSYNRGPGVGVDGDKVWMGGANALRDLPAGQYVWRVLSWNGPAANQSRWTAFRTSTVVAARGVARPGTNGFNLSYGYGIGGRFGGNFVWHAVPNAYAYNLQVRQSGTLYRAWTNLDPRVRRAFNVFTNNDSVVANYEGPALPYGYYRFRVQAINRATPEQTSPWSPWSPVFPIQPF
jgi:hypothetical protein